MKKMSLVMTVILAASISHARGGSDVGTGTQPQKKLNCELIQFTADKGGAYAMDYSELVIAFDKDGEASATGKAEVMGSEDDNLKGLYNITVMTGDKPMFDDNGTAVNVLLKKSEVMSQLEWEDTASSTFTGLKAKSAKVQAYAVVHDNNLSGVATSGLTNKLFKAIYDTNLTLPENQKIRTRKQAMMIEGMTLLDSPQVKQIIQSKFAPGELLMIGLNHACIAPL